MSTDKTCFKCGRCLPLDEFYRHPMMRDGHLNKCKPCTRKDVQERRAVARDYYREYDRRRHREQNRKRVAVIERARDRYPERDLARRLVHQAVKRGAITRPDRCERCGSDYRVSAHHPDYSRPLYVEWLCRVCHGKAHRMEAA